jgi:hypothetical protein
MVKHSFAILSIFLVSCLSSTIRSNKDVLANGAPHAGAVAVYDSLRLGQLWEKIETHPDSAIVDIHMLDGLQARLRLSGDLDSSYYQLKSVHISFSDGRTQALDLSKSIGLLWNRNSERFPCIRLEDINFDAASDLLLFDNAGGTGNVWYEVWLYDRLKRVYVRNKAFTETSGLRISNAGGKELIAYSQNGGLTSAYGQCDEHIGFYTVSGDSLVEKQLYYTYATKDGPCNTYLRQRVDTGWRDTNLGEWDLSLYDSLYLKFDKPGMLHRAKYGDQ